MRDIGGGERFGQGGPTEIAGEHGAVTREQPLKFGTLRAVADEREAGMTQLPRGLQQVEHALLSCQTSDEEDEGAR